MRPSETMQLFALPESPGGRLRAPNAGNLSWRCGVTTGGHAAGSRGARRQLTACDPVKAAGAGVYAQRSSAPPALDTQPLRYRSPGVRPTIRSDSTRRAAGQRPAAGAVAEVGATGLGLRWRRSPAGRRAWGCALSRPRRPGQARCAGGNQSASTLYSVCRAAWWIVGRPPISAEPATRTLAHARDGDLCSARPSRRCAVPAGWASWALIEY